MKLKGNYIFYIKNNPKEKLTNGNETESGILKFFESIEDITEIRRRFPIHSFYNEDERKIEVCLPFNSENKFSVYLRYSYEFYQFFVAVKGAPEIVLEKCKKYMHKGKEYDMTDKFKEEFHKANKCFALKGERVIGLAYKALDSIEYPKDFKFFIKTKDGQFLNSNIPLNDLCFVGLISIEDPPR